MEAAYKFNEIGSFLQPVGQETTVVLIIKWSTKKRRAGNTNNELNKVKEGGIKLAMITK